MVVFELNGQRVRAASDPESPLLWVLREEFRKTGTKFGCGMGLCGACTVHLDGEAVRACLTPLRAATGRRVVTIEGLSPDGKHPVQQAWLETQVAQCGYCQPGQMMTAAALLRVQPSPTDADIEQAMNGHICRCGTYSRVKAAIRKAAGQ